MNIVFVKAIFVVGVILTYWIGFLVMAPSIFRSFLRYKLWRLRDEIVDEIEGNTLSDSDLAEDLISSIESGITFSPYMTLFNVMSLPEPPTSWKESREAFIASQKEQLSASEFRVIEKYRSKYHHAVVIHCLFFSWSGLMLTVPITLFLFVKLFLLWCHRKATKSINSTTDYMADQIVPKNRLSYKYQPPHAYCEVGKLAT